MPTGSACGRSEPAPTGQRACGFGVESHVHQKCDKLSLGHFSRCTMSSRARLPPRSPVALAYQRSACKNGPVKTAKMHQLTHL